LANKQYCIWNKQYSKDEYFEKIKEFNLWSYQNLENTKKKFQTFKQEQPILAYYHRNCENSNGHALFNCKNTIWYWTFNAHDAKYVYNSDSPIDSHDSQWWKYKLNYQWLTNDNSYIAVCSNWCRNSKFVYYSDNCHNCEYIFACVGLKNKKYCILNKQYTKEEYETLVPKIIENMMKNWERGEYFPERLSPFAYNETTADWHYSLSYDDIIKRWYKQMDKTPSLNIPDWMILLKWNEIPDNIDDISWDILGKWIVCQKSGKIFRIMKEELEFYRQNNFPIPRKHPHIRHTERMKSRPWKLLHIKNCDKCSIEILSVYPEDYEWKIYCEACYNHEIYW
jgi:hypothetical protein